MNVFQQQLVDNHIVAQLVLALAIIDSKTKMMIMVLHVYFVPRKQKQKIVK